MDNWREMGSAGAEGKVCVFAPTPILTVTVEQVDDRSELHVHPGGQGVWVARMATVLGAEVTLVGAFGGETGAVARHLLVSEGLDLRAIDAAEPNGAYVHDRRSGERVELVSVSAGTLTRHERDELYGATVATAIESGTCVLTGPMMGATLPDGTYERLAGDLAANGVRVVADLSGDPLFSAVKGRLAALKISDEELGITEGGDDRTPHVAPELLWTALHRLFTGDEHGTEAPDPGNDWPQLVVVSRADRGSVAVIGGHTMVEIEGPSFQPADHRGAGDSMTAGLAVGLARSLDAGDVLRLATAAGAMNSTRHGLASGRREDIEALMARVELSAITGGDASLPEGGVRDLGDIVARTRAL